MALKFDMSKGDWQRDYMMQQAQNQGVNPYRELGEQIATGGGLLGKAAYDKLLPEGGQKIMAKHPNWFKQTSSGYDTALEEWKKKESDAWKNRELEPTSSSATILGQIGDDVNEALGGGTRYYDDTKEGRIQFRKDYAEANPDYLGERPLAKDYQSKYKFTPFKGIAGIGSKVYEGIGDFALGKKEPVLDESGEPKLDEDGKPMFTRSTKGTFDDPRKTKFEKFLLPEGGKNIPRNLMMALTHAGIGSISPLALVPGALAGGVAGLKSLKEKRKAKFREHLERQKELAGAPPKRPDIPIESDEEFPDAVYDEDDYKAEYDDYEDWQEPDSLQRVLDTYNPVKHHGIPEELERKNEKLKSHLRFVKENINECSYCKII